MELFEIDNGTWVVTECIILIRHRYIQNKENYGDICP